MIRTCLVLLVALVGCNDECSRAMARWQRISTRPLPEAVVQRSEDACRNDPEHAKWDPVLSCLKGSPTDEAAKQCIDDGLKHVLGSGAAGDGRGLNPLLDDH
ncbi:MAG TPA: hypothetical protein VGF94_03890 [Kofleriaceae bacterium]|jgi:hypothetical protein